MSFSSLPKSLSGAAASTTDEAPTLADAAYAQLKQMIFDFTLMPGDRCSESELAQRLKVSRTPLRQALQRLEREGFLQVMPKIGWQVAPLDFDTFDELYDLRVLLECHAAHHLAEAEERPALRALAEVWLAPPAERLVEGAEVGRLDEQFHMLLVQGSGNREMARVHREITERIRIIRRLDFTKPARIEATYDEHARILRAITRRRADEAQRLLRAHIEQSKLEVRHITLDMLYRARRSA
ncbi:GntR family transcriptional regulator [Aquincola sp. S2]|uniref:GntR family transcriptional regulator n=1 Tax=Pseudaquabacterium terrae TaxID=2732868 RepID=A0ABX2EHA4_9BURK|nr:GntR family transcriptional regulator [Aquabacterium terrae]NRF68007.1 GntR family transcriptional regulator [Aquabacterium terrae]